MDEYAHLVYKISRTFPKEELYGLVSQMRRAVISVVLNYLEGYARNRIAVRLNFLETSCGSFSETEYIVEFSLLEGLINKDDFLACEKLSNEIGAMLWKELSNVETAVKQNK